MLVLSRKQNEEILIAGNVRVRVLSMRGGRVRLGISAPADVTVDRAEVVSRIHFDDVEAPVLQGGMKNSRGEVLRAS